LARDAGTVPVEVRGYLELYHGITTSEQAREGFKAVLQLTGAWLWENIFEPLGPLLEQSRRAVVIPTGLLGTLPLHIAHYRGKQTGALLLIDVAEVRVSPCASIINDNSGNAFAFSSGKEWSYLGIESPEPTLEGNLPTADIEIRFARYCAPRGKVLPGKAAVIEEVTKALPDHEVWHFACHGKVSFDSPMANEIVLAYDDNLRLQHLIAHDVRGAELVVLSACDLGNVNRKYAGINFGLPNVMLLCCGCKAVIACSWPVVDRVATTLMICVYDGMRRGETPCEALRRGQRLLRDKGARGAAEYLQNLAATLTEEEACDLKARMLQLAEEVRASKRDWSNPFYWGAFVYSGN
jgi:CHAT domain-containing protein